MKTILPGTTAFYSRARHSTPALDCGCRSRAAESVGGCKPPLPAVDTFGWRRKIPPAARSSPPGCRGYLQVAAKNSAGGASLRCCPTEAPQDGSRSSEPPANQQYSSRCSRDLQNPGTAIRLTGVREADRREIPPTILPGSARRSVPDAGGTRIAVPRFCKKDGTGKADPDTRPPVHGALSGMFSHSSASHLSF